MWEIRTYDEMTRHLTHHNPSPWHKQWEFMPVSRLLVVEYHMFRLIQIKYILTGCSSLHYLTVEWIECVEKAMFAPSGHFAWWKYHCMQEEAKEGTWIKYYCFLRSTLHVSPRYLLLSPLTVHCKGHPHSLLSRRRIANQSWAMMDQPSWNSEGIPTKSYSSQFSLASLSRMWSMHVIDVVAVCQFLSFTR